MEEQVRNGVVNILPRVISCPRVLSSYALACIQGRGLHTAGGSSSFRIYWGTPTQPDDCMSHELPIGRLSFRVLDFRGAIPLSECLQWRLNNAHRLGKNQCALISLSAGLVNRTKGPERALPSGSRVRKMEAELRNREREADQAYVQSTGTGRSFDKITVRIVRHVAIRPNNDSD